MLDLESLTTSLLKVMIPPKNILPIICDLGVLALQIISDTWWAYMNIPSTRSISWDKPQHTSSWQLYVQSAIEETASSGIICIICSQVLRHPSSTWVPLSADIFAGKSSHCEVERVNQVRS